MNKYALTLPLVIFSALLGYFGSSLKMIHVYAITTATTVFVATSGYLLFLKHQKAGEDRLKRKRF